MSAQVMKQKWTDQEVGILKEMYRNGMREKQIAQKLKRPVYSVSKKIDMMGLRQYREERKVARQNQKGKQLSFKPHFLKIAQDDPQWDASENDFIKLMGVKNIDDDVIDRQSKESLVNTMIYELRKNGIDVSRIAQPAINNYAKRADQTFCRFKGMPITDGQLLLRFNMMREERGESMLMAPQLLN